MIRPIGKRVVLKEIEASDTTSSGLVLAGQKEEHQMAEVVAVSEKAKVLEVGQTVYFKKYTGTKVKYEDQEYLIIETENVIAIIE